MPRKVRKPRKQQRTQRDKLQAVEARPAPPRAVDPRSRSQADYVDRIRTHDVTFGVGPAGTGKSYLAIAEAVQGLVDRQFARLILTRPAVEAGEKLGFLPGDLSEKVNPYMRPLFDALHGIAGPARTSLWLADGTIEIAPLAFMRGRTLSSAFVILDEAQNTTVEQMKMFLTRLGDGSKAVVTGDVTQVDLPHGVTSGLDDAVAKLARVRGVAVCRFDAADVVRSGIVRRIVSAYDVR